MILANERGESRASKSMIWRRRDVLYDVGQSCHFADVGNNVYSDRVAGIGLNHKLIKLTVFFSYVPIRYFIFCGAGLIQCINYYYAKCVFYL